MRPTLLSLFISFLLVSSAFAQEELYINGKPASTESRAAEPETVTLTPVEKTEKTEEAPKPKSTENSPVFKNSLGLAAGTTTGIGFAYRYWPKKFGFQITAGGIKDSDFAAISGGLTLLNNLAENEYIRFYAYYSNSIYYTESTTTEYTYPQYSYNGPIGGYIYPDPIETRHTTYSRKWNTALGLGTQFKFGKYVGLDLMIGWGGYDNFSRILPAIESALFFKF